MTLITDELYLFLRKKLYELKKESITQLFPNKPQKNLNQKLYIQELYMVNYLSTVKVCNGKQIYLTSSEDYSRYLQEKDPKSFEPLKSTNPHLNIANVFIICATQYTFHLNNYFSRIDKRDILNFINSQVKKNPSTATNVYNSLSKYYESNSPSFWYACVYYSMFDSLFEDDKAIYLPNFNSLMYSYSESTYHDVSDILDITMKYGFKSNISKRQIYATLVNNTAFHANPLLLYEHGMTLFFSGTYENFLKGILYFFQAVANGGTIAAFDCGYSILYYGYVASTDEYSKMISSSASQGLLSIIYNTRCMENDDHFFDRMYIALDYFFYGEKYHHSICTNSIAICLNDIRKYELENEPQNGRRKTDCIKEKIYNHYGIKYDFKNPNDATKSTPTDKAMMQVYEKAAESGNLNAYVNLAHNYIKSVKQKIDGLYNGQDEEAAKKREEAIQFCKKRSTAIENKLISALQKGLLSEAATMLADYYTYCENTTLPGTTEKLCNCILNVPKNYSYSNDNPFAVHEYLRKKKKELYYLGMQNPIDTRNKVICKNEYSKLCNK